MEEIETVAEYMFRINDLINNIRALGEDIKDVDVYKDLSEVKIDELQASLTAYEMRIGVLAVHRREAALKAKEFVEETKAKSKDDLEEDEGQSQKKNKGGNYKGRFGRKTLISDWNATPEEEKPEETQDECLFMAILKAPQTPVQVEEDSDTKIEEILEECERLVNQTHSVFVKATTGEVYARFPIIKHRRFKVELLNNTCSALSFNKREFITTAIRNYKITRMYVKKSDLASAQKVKEKGSLLKTKMMWIPKKLNSASLLVYVAFSACNTQDKWYIDSGYFRHMTGDESKFASLKQFDRINVIFRDNQKAKIIGIGTVNKSEELPEIHEVLLVEGLKHNLLSVSQLCDNGKEVCFNKKKCSVVDLKSKQVLFSAYRSSGKVYTVSEETQNTQCNLTTCDKAKLWHKRLGHLHSRNLSKLLKLKVVKGLPDINFKEDHLCRACQ
ncbi:uncharacterized protein LOC132301761 [Cornus florida]|uniref:uncharacterized protein LOC132301761 n=1 Tax=Cornus florida TaxID=4283 RepID=UPI00289BD13E|nr:uncharacterized protein LOC132301761 [Cornus florida]